MVYEEEFFAPLGQEEGETAGEPTGEPAEGTEGEEEVE